MRKLCVLIALFTLLAAPSWAATIGPVSYTTLGATFTPSGAPNPGTSPGRTWTYGGLNPGAYDALYFGLTTLAAPLLSSPSSSTGQAFSSVSLSGNVATFSFASPWKITTLSGDVNVSVRYTATASIGSWVAGSGVGSIWLPVTTTAFSVTHLFEAFNGSTWVGVNNFFDSVPNKTGGNVVTSVGGGFWYTESVPESVSSLTLLCISLLSVAAVLAISRSAWLS